MNLENRKVAERLLIKINVKLLTLLTQLFAKNTACNSKKLKDDINQMLKELYNSKQITKQAYNMLNKSITYK